MKITKKQQLEISFMELYAMRKYPSYMSTQEHKEEYLNITCLGKGKYEPYWESRKSNPNQLLYAQKYFEVMKAMWEEDMSTGLLGYWEILEDFDHHPFLVKWLDKTRNRMEPKRQKYIKNISELAFVNSKYCVNMI